MVPERSQARANPARGIALIATAVIVGIFLLRNGWEDGGSVAADGADDSAAAGATGGDDGAGTETTATTVAPRQPGEITVRVLNASGVAGAAGATTDALAQAGYQMAEAGNAPEGTDPATTVVLHAAGYEQDAPLVAQAVGAAATSVAALTEPPQVDVAGAQIVVILGTDVAG
ncbi:MAG: LytR C-terminal domain-containing protein [Acidimicrobiales bacterium]